MEKLYFTPQTSGYAAMCPVDEVLRVPLSGGAGRFNADLEEASSIVNVSWTTDLDGYAYLAAFFRSSAQRGKTAFLIDLSLEGRTFTEYTAHFIPSSLTLSGPVGRSRQVSAQLEVAALAEDADADSSIVDIWEASDGDPEPYLNGFAQIIAAWPDA